MQTPYPLQLSYFSKLTYWCQQRYCGYSGCEIGLVLSSETLAMVASEVGARLDELAHQLFDVVTRFCQVVPRGRKRAGDLKDIEFLTLSLLNQREPLIV